MILALRTDTPEAVVILLQQDGSVVKEHRWQADRSLARDLLGVIQAQLSLAGGDWGSLHGLIFFSGPGSFTGLRIGAAVVNTLAHTNRIPVVGVGGAVWMQEGLSRLNNGDNDKLVLPEYGAGAHITRPKK